MHVLDCFGASCASAAGAASISVVEIVRPASAARTRPLRFVIFHTPVFGLPAHNERHYATTSKIIFRAPLRQHGFCPVSGIAQIRKGLSGLSAPRPQKSEHSSAAQFRCLQPELPRLHVHTRIDRPRHHGLRDIGLVSRPLDMPNTPGSCSL
jgi:hypothetical protein